MSFKLSYNHLEKYLPYCDSYSYGLYRALFFGWSTLYFIFERPLLAAYPDAFSLQAPVGLYSFFSPELFQVSYIKFIYPAWIFSLILSCIGLFSRASMIIAAFLGYWVIGHTLTTGAIDHLHQPYLLIFLIFACGSGGIKFSLDNLISEKSPSFNQEYRIGLFLLRSLFVIIFLSAAISKISNGALQWWGSANNIADNFTRSNIWFLDFNARKIFSSLNIILVEQPWLARLASFSVFFLEIITPLVIFKKFRWPIIVSIALFQMAATFSLYVDFESYIALYLFWIPFNTYCMTKRAPDV